jgi:hypothetical protein
MSNIVYNHLPGGKCYQKGGYRLEQAIYKCLPLNIKKHIKLNIRPLNDLGDIIVEYDMIYCNSDEIISFEVKGLNKKTLNCPDRQNKIINQAIRQKKFLTETFAHTDIDIVVVFCFVTGNNQTPIDDDFLNCLRNIGVIVSVGPTPKDSMTNALQQLKTIGFMSNPNLS